MDLPQDPHVISGPELERLHACSKVLEAYEQWEADLILENKSWSGQNVMLTGELYDRTY
jgi:hypothetical protein